MFKTLLVCSDGSDAALNAAHVAVEFARKFEARTLLISSFDMNAVTVPSLGPLEAGIDQEHLMRYASMVQDDVEARTGKVFTDALVPFVPLRKIGHPGFRLVSGSRERDRRHRGGALNVVP